MSQSEQKLILGTRGSELALTQARMVRASLEQKVPGIDVEVRVVQTIGDKRPDLKLSEFSAGPEPVDKGIFTRELEIALKNGDIDIAVHSLKDVPTELDAGFAITAVLPRAATEDVLLSKSKGGIAGLPQGATIATSSVRRARQLRWIRPDLQFVEIRGNVATRIKKLAESDTLDGTLLARAGLERLELLSGDCAFLPQWPELHVAVLKASEFLPAASQGAVGIEVRVAARAAVHEALAAINDSTTMIQVIAEREFLRLLQAGCQTPVGLLSEVCGGALKLSALVFDDDNVSAAPKSAAVTGDSNDPRGAAKELFLQLS
ncbi:MAG: hydroxymethylbilane synthase [Verrucomicrobiales bacterium]|jgi:hydroxymethylbilane synthase